MGIERAPGGSNKKAAAENQLVGMHDDNLYDQNENRAGHRIDEATGKEIDNSTDKGFEALRIVNVHKKGKAPKSGDLLGDIENDASEIDPAWIAAEAQRLQNRKKQRPRT